MIFLRGSCFEEHFLNALIDVGSCASVFVNGLFVKRPKSVEECVLDPLSVTLQKNYSKSCFFHMAAMRSPRFLCSLGDNILESPHTHF